MTAPVPIRMFSDAEALAWLQARPDDPLSASALARAWGWPRIRARRRLEAWKAAGLIGQPGQEVATISAPMATVAGQPGHLTFVMDRPDGRGRHPLRIAGALVIDLVGLGLAAIGMAATITYSVETTGALTGALAAAADTLALVLPAAAARVVDSHVDGRDRPGLRDGQPLCAQAPEPLQHEGALRGLQLAATEERIGVLSDEAGHVDRRDTDRGRPHHPAGHGQGAPSHAP